MPGSAPDPRVSILGIFVADLTFRAPRQPAMGETLLGASYSMGPGGKGSNQAVAAARAGAKVTFISRLGKDTFGANAVNTWKAEGIAPHVTISETEPTGAACIFLNSETGDNAIIVVPGAAGTIGVADVEAASGEIQSSAVFVTQLEQPVAAAMRGLEIARKAGVVTVLNPAPAATLPDRIFPLCDYIVPNEGEAQAITGIGIAGPGDARKAADVLLKKGAKSAIVTLGDKGALFHSAKASAFLPAIFAGRVADTTGAGDSFVGAFAAAIAQGEEPVEAARFASAAAAISVTRPGAASAMPTLAEINAILSRT